MLKKFLKKRYQNSLETKFSKLLYGIDDVKSEHTVIMVEGIFDKDNVDLCIDKYGLQDKFSCVCTFGKKLSKEQIKLLKEKGVDKILLFWDLDAEKTIRSNVDKFKKFKRVWLTFTDDPEKDAGNSTPKEIKNYISKKVTLQDFLSKRVLIDVLN